MIAEQKERGKAIANDHRYNAQRRNDEKPFKKGEWVERKWKKTLINQSRKVTNIRNDDTQINHAGKEVSLIVLICWMLHHL